MRRSNNHGVNAGLAVILRWVPESSILSAHPHSAHDQLAPDARPQSHSGLAAMQLAVTTWNINSVRLRFPIVRDLIEQERPDVLCLQETKTPDDKFPAAEFRALGYLHQAIIGNKGYNGVAILSRLPFSDAQAMPMCGKPDARHMSVTLAGEARKAAGITIHNFYVPAGGDEPDPSINDKFAHKLAFLAEMDAWARAFQPTGQQAILVGDLNIAPYETDVWSHKQLLDVVSHTPVETQTLERLRADHGWVDAIRQLMPEPERVYTWWSYRAADWEAADKGRRLDHVWLSPSLADALHSADIHKHARGWERPSDHAPITVRLAL
jgi:exodeoxyribonuclease-3